MTEPKRPKKQPNALSQIKQSRSRKTTSTRNTNAQSKTAASAKLDLFVLRHGEAGNRMTVVEKDSERPLTPEGRSEMQKIAKSLKSVGFQANRIYTSPLRRARETAEIAARVLKIPVLEAWDELKPEGSRAALYRKLARVEKDSRLILVGHEPYLSSMIGEIIGTPGARLVLKKGGLGKVRINSFTPQISGELRWLLTPKIITRMT